MIISLKNKVTLAKRALDLVAGTLKHTPNGSFTIGSESVHRGEPRPAPSRAGRCPRQGECCQGSLAGRADVARREYAKVDPVLRGYQSLLLVTYGNAPATLADYGLAPRKGPTPQSANVKAAAVAKRAATRTARHTMGKKQKAEIKGAEPVTTGSAPATAAPASPPVAPSPVASAPNTGTSAGTAPRTA